MALGTTFAQRRQLDLGGVFVGHWVLEGTDPRRLGGPRAERQGYPPTVGDLHGAKLSG